MLENAVADWVCHLWSNNVLLNDSFTQEKARRVQESLIESLPPALRTKFTFGKKRNQFKAFKSHGEVGAAVETDIAENML